MVAASATAILSDIIFSVRWLHPGAAKSSNLLAQRLPKYLEVKYLEVKSLEVSAFLTACLNRAVSPLASRRN
jgi:hypothetical protein